MLYALDNASDWIKHLRSRSHQARQNGMSMYRCDRLWSNIGRWQRHTADCRLMFLKKKKSIMIETCDYTCVNAPSKIWLPFAGGTYLVTSWWAKNSMWVSVGWCNIGVRLEGITQLDSTALCFIKVKVIFLRWLIHLELNWRSIF